MTIQPLDRSEHEQCLDDILTIYFRAVDAGQTPNREELFEHHPELADELRDFFLGEDRLDQFAAPLRPVVQAARHDLLDTRMLDKTLSATDDYAAQELAGVIGEYEILEEIAQGGMGVVYKARHRQLHRFVALKLLLAGPFARPADLQRFRSETEMVASLDHPNIVPIYDVGEHDRQPYFSMKLIEGGSLDGHAERFMADPRMAAELLVSLAKAVHHAHQRGILHRDLKPSNVLLDREGRPHLTDFGLARWVAEDNGLSQSGAIVGTPSYMAPEQMLGRRQLVTTASDVYGLGAILFYVLTGKPPFRGETPLETLQQVQEREPERPRSCNPLVPRDLEIICLHCLAKEPKARYASALALAEDLAKFLGGAPILARNVSRWERVQKWVIRKPALAALAAVSCAALVALMAGGIVYEHRLRGAWAEAEANALDARVQKDRADANYRQARETLVRMLQKTRERDVVGVPRLRELERRQSEEAIAFYLKIAEQTGNDPEIRQDSAMAQREAALLQFDLGRTPEAIENLELASSQFAQLIASFPGEPSYRLGRASCLTALGGMNVPEKECEQYHTEALALAENLVRDFPQNGGYQLSLANICNQTALVRARQNRLAEANLLFHRAIELRETILASQPDDPVIRANIAETCVNFSQFAYRCGDGALGKRLHDRAEAEFKRLLEKHPEDFLARTSLAALRINWAYVLGAEKNDAGAEAELTANIQDLGMLLQQEPESAVVRNRLFRSYGLRAEIYTGHKQYVEALYDTQKAAQMATPEERDFYRLFLAMAFARAGKHAKAIDEAQALATKMTAKTPYEQRVHLGSVCGVAAKAAGKDPSMSEAARTALAAHYVSIGLEQMREARHKVTYLEWLLQMPEFLSNADLAPLRAAPKWLELFKPQ